MVHFSDLMQIQTTWYTSDLLRAPICMKMYINLYEGLLKAVFIGFMIGVFSQRNLE